VRRQIVASRFPLPLQGSWEIRGVSTSVQHIMPKYEQLLEVTCLIDSQIIMQNGTVCLLQNFFYLEQLKNYFTTKRLSPQ
jgi:hypothetical protein